MAFTAVYDANVLHPASLRDLLIRLAASGLFRAKWTDEILDEAFESVLRAITKQAAALSQPPMTFDELLDRLSEVGLSRSVAAMRDRSSSAAWVQHIPEL